MTFTDYLIDSALVLLVLLQVRERELTTRMLVRPFVLAAIPVAIYLHGIPTGGHDLLLVALLGLLGTVIGLASGQTVLIRRGPRGEVLARAGWSSAVYWILGMGSRFAFIVWITHGGRSAIGHFSANHAISGQAWTAALLAMAILELSGRTLVLALRARAMERPLPQPA